jgi:hypothetical protein
MSVITVINETMTVADLLAALDQYHQPEVRAVLTEILYAAAASYDNGGDGYESACWHALHLAAKLVRAYGINEEDADDIISHLARIASFTLSMDGGVAGLDLSSDARAQLEQIARSNDEPVWRPREDDDYRHADAGAGRLKK